MDWQVILVSAAFGAIMSAFFNSVALVVNTRLSERYDRKKLLFQKSFELADRQASVVEKIAKENEQDYLDEPIVYTASQYYELLHHYFKNNGGLPDDYRNEIEQQKESYLVLHEQGVTDPRVAFSIVNSDGPASPSSWLLSLRALQKTRQS